MAIAVLMFAPLLAGQDLRQIVRHAVDLDARNLRQIATFLYDERRETHEFDGSGKVRKDEIRTWNVIPLEGSSYRRLIARNDVPLSAAEIQFEADKLRFTTGQRQKETPAERQRRISEWEKRQMQRTHEPLKEMPDAFDFTPAGETIIDGRTVWVLDAHPHPGYHAKSTAASFFPKVRGRIWIDKVDGQWVKVDAETLDTISFAAFLLRVAKGTRYTAEQTRISSDLWAPKRIWYKAAARIAIFKTIQIEMDTRLTNYRKPAGPPPAIPTSR